MTQKTKKMPEGTLSGKIYSFNEIEEWICETTDTDREGALESQNLLVVPDVKKFIKNLIQIYYDKSILLKDAEGELLNCVFMDDAIGELRKLAGDKLI